MLGKGEKAEKKDNIYILTIAHKAGRRQKIPYSFFFFFFKLSPYALKSRIAYLGKDNAFMSRMHILLHLGKAAQILTQFCKPLRGKKSDGLWSVTSTALSSSEFMKANFTCQSCSSSLLPHNGTANGSWNLTLSSSLP